MARGVPAKGFRLTKKRAQAGWSKDNGVVHFHHNQVEEVRETEAEIDQRIRDRFEVLETMTKVRIKQVLGAGMLRVKGFTEDEEGEILAFIEQNINSLRELSLRMVLKVAGMMDISPSNWQKMAHATCCKQK